MGHPYLSFFGLFLQGMDSEHAEVRALLAILSPKVADCHEKLIAQGVSNSLYGLQSMSSDHFEVRKLVDVLAYKVLESQACFDAQAVGNAFYGLQRMNSEHMEVRKLVAAVADKVATFHGKVDAQVIPLVAVFYTLYPLSLTHPSDPFSLALIVVFNIYA